MAATIIGTFAAAAWLYLLVFRGRFWRVETNPSGTMQVAPRKIVAVIPARDEAPVIGRALASLFAQDYVGSLHVVVVDDHSSDGTADIARAAAASTGCGQRLTVIAARPLPMGWTGKLWAMSEGVAAARALDPDYLLLTDADIVHGRQELAGLVARAESGYDLVSLMVRLNCRSLWERLLIPAFVFFFFKLYPPRWVADRTSRTAAAAGGCILVRPAALDRIGGIDRIRSEIIDDCALARRIKHGGAVWLGATAETQSIREYTSWRPIWDLVARCAFAQLQYSAVLLALMVIGMAALYLAPPLLLLSGNPAAMLLGAIAWLIMAAAFVPMLRLYKCSVWFGLLLPVIAGFYTAATIASAVQFWRGRGGSWKGRFQAAAAS
ncbi:MAG TPA: glycosyltransferase [Stellaceae bacterium]|nr:glycosyltransferase [Stellaceae bacterium]